MADAENSTPPASKRKVGRPFPKGVSGNPGGREKGIRESVKALVGQDGDKLVRALYAIGLGTPQDLKDAFGSVIDVQTKERRECIKELLDRGFGRPVQAHELSGPDGEPIHTIARVIVDGSDPTD